MARLAGNGNTTALRRLFMHGSRTARIAAAVLMAAVAACSDDATDPETLNSFYGIANGASERPAVTTTASGTADVDHASGVFNFSVAYTGLSAAPTAVQIQIGNATAVSSTSAIAVDLCGGGAPACPATAAGTVAGATAAAYFRAGHTASSVLSSMRGNTTFVNIKTAANANGEIRANLVPTP
jgi:hypothetical protein